MRQQLKRGAVLSIAALAVAGPLATSSASAALAPSGAAAGASSSASAAAENMCTTTDTVKDDNGHHVNVSLCMDTDGRTLTVTFHADCFAALGPKWPHCEPEGSWSLTSGQDLITTGEAGNPASYPGPGPYTLSASFTVEAWKTPRESEGGGSAGFTLGGTMSRDVTFATAIAPGPRLTGVADTVGGKRTLTITNVGDKPANGVHIWLTNVPALGSDIFYAGGPPQLSDDPHCSGRAPLTECSMGDVAPRAAVSVALSKAATGFCPSFGSTPTLSWDFGADNYPIAHGEGPC